MFYKQIAKTISQNANTQVMLDEPMARHTSLSIGGAADIFVAPKGTESLQQILKIADSEKMKRFVIGNGTNLLVSDDGIRGIVIQIKDGFKRISVDKKDDHVIIEAEAGILLNRVLNESKENGLTGFEFSAGIPGSLGGAIVMNASTKLGAISDTLQSIEVLTKGGKTHTLSRDELDFHYRELKVESSTIILSAKFRLAYSTREEVEARVNDFLAERRLSQPKGKSAGCIFRNPDSDSAGRIIDELGYKGKRVGGAYVSSDHGNFIMNDGTASSKDFITLIREIRAAVLEEKSIKLEYEIKFLGNM